MLKIQGEQHDNCSGLELNQCNWYFYRTILSSVFDIQQQRLERCTTPSSLSLSTITRTRQRGGWGWNSSDPSRRWGIFSSFSRGDVGEKKIEWVWGWAREDVWIFFFFFSFSILSHYHPHNALSLSRYIAYSGRHLTHRADISRSALKTCVVGEKGNECEVKLRKCCWKTN